MSEENIDLQEQALALDPMDPNPVTAMPDHAPGTILAEMAGGTMERGKDSASKLAAPAGLALATAGCSSDTIKSLESRPGEGGWAYLFRLILENPKSAVTIALIIGGALFGIRNTLKGVGSLIKDGAKATGRFLIAANERGPQNPIVPGSLQNILAGFDDNATPALSMMQNANRQRIVALERDLRNLFSTLRFNDQGSGTALYENIVRLAYTHGLLQEIGNGTFVMPGAPAAAPVPAGPHRAPRHAAAAAAPAGGGRTLAQRRDDLLTEYESLWRALAADNLTVTAAEGFEANLQALVTTVGTIYRLNPAEQDCLRQTITTFLSRAPYYRSSVDRGNVLEDRHRRLLTGEFKRAAVNPARTRAATALARFPMGAPGPLGAMADQIDHGRAETVDRVATVIDGNVPRRRRVRDTIIRGAMAPRGTRRGYVGDVSARSFGLGGNAWALWQLAGMAVGAGEPVPVKPPAQQDPAGAYGSSSPEAVGAESAAEGGQQARSSIAIIKAAADAREIVDKKNELREVVEMLRTGKNELGDDMTGPDRERLDKALRDLETRLRELGVPQEKIDGIKNPPKTEEKSSETTTAEKHEEIKFPDITSPKSGFRIHDDDVEYR